MTAEQLSIVYRFSDVELLKFHAMGGNVPHSMKARLYAALAVPDLKINEGPELGCSVPWRESCSRIRERRYAIENLIARRLPARRTA